MCSIVLMYTVSITVLQQKAFKCSLTILFSSLKNVELVTSGIGVSWLVVYS